MGERRKKPKWASTKETHKAVRCTGADETRWQHTERVQHREHVLGNTQNMFNTESTFLFHSYSS
jgi:hypothetical protein